MVKKIKQPTEREGFVQFLKGPCPICGKKGLEKDAGLTAKCTLCTATFVYGASAINDEIARLGEIKKGKELKAKERRDFIEKASDSFLQEVPASDVAIEVCVAVIAKMMHTKNKELSASEVQGKVNDIADLIGTEAFKLFHNREA